MRFFTKLEIPLRFVQGYYYDIREITQPCSRLLYESRACIHLRNGYAVGQAFGMSQ